MLILARHLHLLNLLFIPVLLQHSGDPNIKNTDGKSPLDLADPAAKSVLLGVYFFRDFFDNDLLSTSQCILTKFCRHICAL